MTVPLKKLHDGVEIPQLGFGVWQVPPEQTAEVVLQALQAGYRHIDTAAGYGNEAGVGDALRASGIAREDVFITTKLANSEHGRDKTLAAFDDSMAKLGLDYLDLYLIHWPTQADDYVETWQAFEEIKASGRVRTIGVSNFQKTHLRKLLDETGTVPTVNQVEVHPYLVQSDLRGFNDEHGIATEAWSPLAQRLNLVGDPVVTGIAGDLGRTPAQVVIRWHLQQGNIVIPKSVTPERIVANFDVTGFELSDDQVAAITALDRDERTGPDPDVFG
ncbi:aldo/keto reductase [Kineococcus rhizosphaerae]|uniref:Diketogulonate reductase-like aldo/keto reductase n=1 Tax=Kineococcus rhizosphaerae TaxID=559628 RepID=A0A2T0QXS1_9ACTN|nr:aldo/keto reductase [Kineococcus rhizosphaerae]PRY10823.1 diketogulonate reductase-like aldo/keto reductase [Kineococcus rhizosphaerae]